MNTKQNGFATCVATNRMTGKTTTHTMVAARITPKRVYVQGHVFDRVSGEVIRNIDNRIMSSYSYKLTQHALDQ